MKHAGYLLRECGNSTWQIISFSSFVLNYAFSSSKPARTMSNNNNNKSAFKLQINARETHAKGLSSIYTYILCVFRCFWCCWRVECTTILARFAISSSRRIFRPLLSGKTEHRLASLPPRLAITREMI